MLFILIYLRPAAAQGGALSLPRLPARGAGGRLRRRRRAEDLLQVAFYTFWSAELNKYQCWLNIILSFSKILNFSTESVILVP